MIVYYTNDLKTAITTQKRNVNLGLETAGSHGEVCPAEVEASTLFCIQSGLSRGGTCFSAPSALLIQFSQHKL